MTINVTPDIDYGPLEPPIAVCPQQCGEGFEIQSEPSNLPDELAYTGPVEVTGALMGAVVLIWAGLALRGRRA